MRTKQQFITENLDTWDLMDRLVLSSYASGSYSPESKRSRVQNADSQISFPSFIPVLFDGRFFGPFSSEIENAYALGNQAGYFEEANYTRKYEPVHLSRKLTDKGQRYAEDLVKRSEDFGLKKFDKFIARMLAISSLPIELTVALGIYYGKSEKNKKLVQLKESLSEPYSIYCTTNGTTIEKVVNKIKETDLVIKEKTEFLSKNEREFIINYSINKNQVRNRYSYLILPENLDTITRQYEVKRRDDEKKFLLENCCNDLDYNNSELRRRNITELLKRYPKTLKHYTAELRSILELIEKNEDVIRAGYHHIFEVQERIAELSEDFPLSINIRIEDDRTTSYLNVDDKVKSDVRKMIDGEHVWHRGLDLYVQHIPQFLDRIFLDEHNYKPEALDDSLKIKPSNPAYSNRSNINLRG